MQRGAVGHSQMRAEAEPAAAAVRLQGCRCTGCEHVVGGGCERFVDRLVGSEEGNDIGGQNGLLDGKGSLMEPAGDFAGDEACRRSGEQFFDAAPRVDDAQPVAAIKWRDRDAGAGSDLQKPIPRQPLNGFANGRAAEADFWISALSVTKLPGASSRVTTIRSSALKALVVAGTELSKGSDITRISMLREIIYHQFILQTARVVHRYICRISLEEQEDAWFFRDRAQVRTTM